MRGLAFEFLASAEFGETAGDAAALGGQALVEALYLTVLDRPGEPDGVAFWTGIYDDPGFDAADLLIAFAESPENVGRSPIVSTLAETGDGVWTFAD